MPKNTFFLRTRDLLVSKRNGAKTLFSHPPSPFDGNFCNCNSIGICTALQFKVQLPLLNTAWSNAYSKIGLEVRCDVLLLLAWKITKRIHSSKPASLNRPILFSALHDYYCFILLTCLQEAQPTWRQRCFKGENLALCQTCGPLGVFSMKCLLVSVFYVVVCVMGKKMQVL